MPPEPALALGVSPEAPGATPPVKPTGVAVSWLRSEEPCAAKVKMEQRCVVQSVEPNFACTGRDTVKEPSELIRPFFSATQMVSGPKASWSVGEKLSLAAMPT